jgi:hypothetical protein
MRDRAANRECRALDRAAREKIRRAARLNNFTDRREAGSSAQTRRQGIRGRGNP